MSGVEAAPVPAGRRPRGQALAAVAIAAAGGLVLAVAANLVAWVGMEAFPADPIHIRYGDRALGPVYPGRTTDEIRALLRETWDRPAAFKPFTLTAERRFQGRWVNVEAAGFRRSHHQGPWPPDPSRANVFVFGGSTTFGYGVADDETLVSALQDWLEPRLAPRPVACYNFGSAGYYSSQERIRFQELLAAGHVPALAVFVDGLNDFAVAVPWPFAILKRSMDAPVSAALKVLVDNLPLTRLVGRLKARRGRRPDPAQLAAAYGDAAVLDERIDRWLGNRRLIRATASAWGLPVLFVFQPVPTYGYDLRYHLFGDFDFEQNNFSAFGYPRMAERLRAEPPRDDFLWAADIQNGVRQPLYVDGIHYTAAMNALVAEEVGRAVLQRHLLR